MVPVPVARLAEVHRLLGREPSLSPDAAGDLLAQMIEDPNEDYRALLGLLASQAVASPLSVRDAASRLDWSPQHVGGVVHGIRRKFGPEPFRRLRAGRGETVFRMDAQVADRIKDLLDSQVATTLPSGPGRGRPNQGDEASPPSHPATRAASRHARRR
jgi:hypothetical protein